MSNNSNWPIDTTLLGSTTWVGVDAGIMAMEGHSTFLKSSYYLDCLVSYPGD